MLGVWQFILLKQNSISPSFHGTLSIATAAVCKYSSHQQSWCWRGPSRPAWGRVRVWRRADTPRRAADRWRLWRAGRLLSTGLPWIKCGVLSHVVTYASLVQDHSLSLFLSLSLSYIRITLLWFLGQASQVFLETLIHGVTLMHWLKTLQW